MPNVKQLEGVNYLNPTVPVDNVVYTSEIGHCQHTESFATFDISLPESSSNPKIIVCNTYTCLYQVIDPNTKCEKMYCYKHKVKLAKQIDTQKKIDEKIAKKEEIKKKKEEEKQLKKAAIKEIKNAKKSLHTKIGSENIVIGPVTIDNKNATVVGCVQILKTGVNKGTSCGKHIFSGNLCKRHLPKNDPLIDVVSVSNQI